jgi:glycosyltransferase involved in cell wall biosynthesis
MSVGLPFFSIIVPVYNGTPFLNVLIGELLSQSIQSFELIIVDDGSTDSTFQIIQPFLIDKRIKYFYQSNQGVAAARNKGVVNSNGKFIIFLDCDDHPYATMLEKYFENISKRPQTLLLFSQYHSQGKVKGLRTNSYVFNLPVSVIPGSYCISRALFNEIGGFDADMSHSENWELFMRIGLYQKMNPTYILTIAEPLFEYTAVYSVNKLLKNKVNKIKSYSALYRKHQNKQIYSSSRLSYFAQVVANNYAGLGDLNNLIKWTGKSVYTYPFSIKNYYKPFFIFIKRKLIPYS